MAVKVAEWSYFDHQKGNHPNSRRRRRRHCRRLPLMIWPSTIHMRRPDCQIPALGVSGDGNHSAVSPYPHKGTVLSEKSEANLANVKHNLELLDNMLSERPGEWEQWLSTARSATRAIDAMSFLKDTGRLQEQVWLIQVLQDYAFHDADEGCIRDIARWCQSSWLRVLRDHPDNVTILKGLGNNWLQISQGYLARIHNEEGSCVSSDSTVNKNAQGPLHVEARTHLQPAVDFFSKAVAAAEGSNSLTGELLSSAAEASMNLGNVSPSSCAEQHFARAVKYLRRTVAIPGYSLSTFFQEYLDDYGRFVAA
ncbi:hypothetical protein V495_03941 [Pseudogymnoascus sp. VKM F-4514 (FW-929)]|nr:hypothetical protein V495_03941 [Pseudogymnoascus sp. VKM F-4514 (FW-929)]KFY58751.1 hypothetical protein V497_04671 [Pseudogymnoascus sp. VKM F-4516 (FW-969)]